MIFITLRNKTNTTKKMWKQLVRSNCSVLLDTVHGRTSLELVRTAAGARVQYELDTFRFINSNISGWCL